jgi:hypothetical protein
LGSTGFQTEPSPSEAKPRKKFQVNLSIHPFLHYNPEYGFGPELEKKSPSFLHCATVFFSLEDSTNLHFGRSL